MTRIARTMSSMPSFALPAARPVRAAVEGALAAVAGWWARRPSWHNGTIDDHTLRDVGIARIDVA